MYNTLKPKSIMLWSGLFEARSTGPVQSGPSNGLKRWWRLSYRVAGVSLRLLSSFATPALFNPKKGSQLLNRSCLTLMGSQLASVGGGQSTARVWLPLAATRALPHSLASAQQPTIQPGRQASKQAAKVKTKNSARRLRGLRPAEFWGRGSFFARVLPFRLEASWVGLEASWVLQNNDLEY